MVQDNNRVTLSQTRPRQDLNVLWILGAVALVALVILVARSVMSSEEPSDTPPSPAKAAAIQKARDTGIELFNKGKIKESIPPLEQATAAGTADSVARTTLALAYTATNRPKKAQTQYESILKEKPKDAPTLYRLGLLKQQLKQPKESVKFLEQAVGADPKISLFRAELAKAYSLTGAHDKALAQWQQVLKLTPAKDAYRATILVQMGDVYLASNQKPRAIAAYQAALLVDPSNRYTKQQLSRVGK